MKRHLLYAIRMALVIVTSSYLTLGIFAPQAARNYWWQYALVVLALSLSNLICGRRRRNGRSKRQAS